MKKKDYKKHAKKLSEDLNISLDKVELSLKYFQKALKKTINNKKSFNAHQKVSIYKIGLNINKL